MKIMPKNLQCKSMDSPNKEKAEAQLVHTHNDVMVSSVKALTVCKECNEPAIGS